jgi:DHA1 family tetracycline resistance protein-like MFS transporter
VAMALQKRPAFTLGALWQALSRPRVGPLLHTRFFFSLAFATLQSIFGLYALARFGLEAQSTGLILAYIGVLSVLVQGFGIAWMTKRFSEKNLIFVGSIIMTLGLLGWAFAPNIPFLLIAMTPIALAGGTMNTVLSSALTKSVYPEEIGGTLGLATSVESVTRIISPIMGGFLLEKFSSSAPGIVSALIMVWVISFIWRRLIVNPDPPLPTRGGSQYSTAQGD